MASTLFLVPAFCHQTELSIVLKQLRGCDVLVIDDGSPRPLTGNAHIIRHTQNKGYGAAQKTGFSFALAHGYEHIALVHGDNQYSVSHMQKALSELSSEVLLGSRFLGPSSTMPSWRRWGNRVLTGSVNRKFGCHHTDLHTGARIYSAPILKQIPYFSFSDDFLFDHQMILWCIQHKIHMTEFSIPAKYDHSVSSISLWRSLQYGLGCLLGILTTTPYEQEKK